MKSNYRRLGDYIRQTDIRNEDLSVKKLLGVSIDKVFIESHANTVGVDFSNYKIVKRGQFAYGPVTSRNGDKISIAKLEECDECIISSSYTSFEISKPDELNADYLMMLFRNPEFDRYARYNSWGSAREVFSWDELCRTEMNIPSIEEQEKIVGQYKTIERRIELLTKINNKLYDLIHLDYLKVTDGIENTKKISEIGEFVRGKNITSSEMVYGEIDVISAGLLPSGKHNKWNVRGNSITISGSGANAGYFSLHYENIWAADCSYCNKTKYLLFLFESLKSVKDKIEGLKDGHSAQPHVYPKDVNEFLVKFPNDKIVSAFEDKADKIARVIADNLREIDRLLKIKNLFIYEL